MLSLKKQQLMVSVASFLFAFHAFLLNRPYYIWSTYNGGILSSVAGIPVASFFGVIAVVATFVYILLYGFKVTKSVLRLVMLSLGMPLFTIIIAGGYKSIVSGQWLIYILATAYVLLPNKIKKRIYDYYLLLFVITIIPSLLYYFLTRFGIAVPYTNLESYELMKRTGGLYYKLYPFAVQIMSDYSLFIDARLCGIYDEPGLLGTLAGMFLISEGYNVTKNWKTKILFLSGILSFSFAFWAFSFINYIFYLLKNNNTKKLILITILPIAYLILINLDLSDYEILSRFQSRFIITDGWLKGDNRTDDTYNSLFLTLFSDGWMRILFGHGLGAFELLKGDSSGGFSYKSLIYDYGFFGFLLQILWFVSAAFSYIKINSHRETVIQVILILTVYLGNIYQRPSMMCLGFMIIFFGGLINANSVNVDKYNIDKD